MTVPLYTLYLFIHCTCLFTVPVYTLYLFIHYCLYTVPVYTLYLSIHCTCLYTVPVYTLYLSIHCTCLYTVSVYTLYLFIHYLFIHCTCLYTVPVYTLLFIHCTCLYTVPVYTLYLSIHCICLYTTCLFTVPVYTLYLFIHYCLYTVPVYTLYLSIHCTCLFTVPVYTPYLSIHCTCLYTVPVYTLYLLYSLYLCECHWWHMWEDLGKNASCYLGNGWLSLYFLWFISKVRCCSIYIHDVYVDWNVPCISCSPKCYYGHLWDCIWWYAPYKYFSNTNITDQVKKKSYNIDILLYHYALKEKIYKHDLTCQILNLLKLWKWWHLCIFFQSCQVDALCLWLECVTKMRMIRTSGSGMTCTESACPAWSSRSYMKPI